MPRICADHTHNALSADNLTVLAYTFYRASDFHTRYLLSHIQSQAQELANNNAGPAGLMAKDYPPSIEIVRRHLNNNGIAGQNPNKVHSHLARNMRHNLVTVFQFNFEHRVGQSVGHLGLQSNCVLLCHFSCPLVRRRRYKQPPTMNSIIFLSILHNHHLSQLSYAQNEPSFVRLALQRSSRS